MIRLRGLALALLVSLSMWAVGIWLALAHPLLP